MDKKNKIILVAVILATAILIGFLLFGSSGNEQEAENKETAPGAGGAGEESTPGNSLADLLAGASSSPTNVGLAAQLGLQQDPVTGYYQTARLNVPGFGFVKIYSADLSNMANRDMYVIEESGQKIMKGDPKFNEITSAIQSAPNVFDGKIKLGVA